MLAPVNAYYNEFDPYAAQWLRNLVAAGHIADGVVDERSIVDVQPDDLREFAQCHFFAGIGGWSYGARLAGWADDRPLWTGSCPCQPFSVAGAKAGTEDARHLWPEWFRLIRECRPGVVFGEQVEAAIRHGWLDLVQADMEGIGYAVGAGVLPAAGFGAPHIRQRLWFVADTMPAGRAERWSGTGNGQTAGSGIAGVLGESTSCGCERIGHQPAHSEPMQASAPGSFWSNADWLPCRDGKARPVEPIAQQMADGSTASLGRLRPDTVSKVAKEVAHAYAGEADARKALFYVWEALGETALQRTAGRLSGVHEAPVLLAFLRQLADQGWTIAQGIPRSSEETSEASLRGVRIVLQATRASHQRGLEGQSARERADAVRVLSPILARHAQAAWGETFHRNAAATFPLAHGIIGRVGRLRAYGNAIVPQVAAEVIRAYMECRP